MIGQITPETKWERDKIGRFSSSEITKLLTPGKRKMTPEELAARPKKGKGSATEYVDDYSVLSTGAMTYVLEKAAQINTKTMRQMETSATEWGKAQEPHAVEKLEKFYPGIVHYGGNNPQFFKYTLFSGGSPDAEWKYNTVFEIKCPENPANHEEYMDLLTADALKANKPDYYAQLQMNMAVVAKKNGEQFKDMKGVFVSFDPRYDENLQLHIVEVAPDFELIEQINKAIESAEIVLADRIERQRNKAVSTPSPTLLLRNREPH